MAADTVEATPKRGGTLTYMIPADAPPSLDGHREGTFAMLHAMAPFYSVLMRVNPENPSDTTQFVCDLCTAIPKPTDDGKTYTFKIRDGVKFHDGSPLTAADVAASWHKIIFPPKGVLSARQDWWSVVDSVEAPDPTTVVFRLKFATNTFLPSLADPFAFIYSKAILDKDVRWYEQHVMGSGPFKFVSHRHRPVDQGRTESGLLPQGNALSRRLHRHLRRQAGGAGRGDPLRSGGDGVPRPAAVRDQRPSAGTRRQGQGADPRLELRQPDHAQPEAQAVRRRAGAPRAAAGHRSVARRAGAVEDRQRAHRGGHRVPRLAAGGDQGGTAEAGRLLARHREVACRGPASAEGSRPGRAAFRAAQPERRSAVQIRRHLAGRSMEQDRREGNAARTADRPVAAGDAQRRLRRRGRGQLQQRRESRAGHAQISAAREVSGELRRLQRSGTDRDLREDAARDRLRQATGADATVRDAHHRHPGARVSDAVVVPHDPRAVLCAWLEDRPQPLHQPGSVQYLAGRGRRTGSRCSRQDDEQA